MRVITKSNEKQESAAAPSSNRSAKEGHDSGDEGATRIANGPMRERDFEALLKNKLGFIIRKMKEDGNCLFRAVADQIYGDPEMHGQVRKYTMDYMVAEREHFSQFITEDFDDYIARKRKETVYGNHTELQAMCEMYNRPIEVYSYSDAPVNVFQGQYKTDNAPLRLSYHNAEHYNSVIDPHTATVGVGLGLPGFQPGQADKNLMEQAYKKSEEEHLESQLYESAVMDDILRKSLADADAIPPSLLAERKGAGAAVGGDYVEDADADALERAMLEQARAESAREMDDVEQQIMALSRQEYLASLRNGPNPYGGWRTETGGGAGAQR